MSVSQSGFRRPAVHIIQGMRNTRCSVIPLPAQTLNIYISNDFYRRACHVKPDTGFFFFPFLPITSRPAATYGFPQKYIRIIYTHTIALVKIRVPPLYYLIAVVCAAKRTKKKKKNIKIKSVGFSSYSVVRFGCIFQG